MLEILLDTAVDTLKLIPFLFLTYLLMEYLEHKTGEKAKQMIGRAGRMGPVVGGILGVFPQCGFSAAASGLYSGRVITMGTLIAIYLSTSDEMIPVMISEKAPVSFIVKVLMLKMIIGIAAGMAVDLLVKRQAGEKSRIQEEKTHCCEHGIFLSAVNPYNSDCRIHLFDFLGIKWGNQYDRRGADFSVINEPSCCGRTSGRPCRTDSKLCFFCRDHTALSGGNDQLWSNDVRCFSGSRNRTGNFIQTEYG